jgi:hypothetical protein
MDLAKRLKELESENSKLKRLVANLSLENLEVIQAKVKVKIPHKRVETS